MPFGLPLPQGQSQPPAPDQQQAPPQQTPQQTDLAHHALIGKAVSALMGNSTSYAVDPQTGQTVATPQKQTPGQWGRSMVLGAMLGLASASGGDAKGGNVGGFAGGVGRGGTAVAEHGEQQDQLKMQRAQEQYKNQLEAQRNQREQQKSQQESQVFQTEQTHRQAMIAAENAQTIRTQQLIKGDSFKQFEEEAANGRTKVSPYIVSGIQPAARDKTWQEISDLQKQNPKAGAWDWEQTGVKTVMNPDGTSTYVPTFDAYDPQQKVPITKSFLDLMKKARVDDAFPGTTDRLKEGQELSPSEFAAIKGNYQTVYNQNLEREKALLAAGVEGARIKQLNAEAQKEAADALRGQKNEKQSAQLADGLDKWTAAGGDQAAFGTLDKKSQVFITNGLVKQIDSIERQIKDASSQIPPDQERMDELKGLEDTYRTYLRMAVPSPGANLPKAPSKNASIPEDVMSQYLKIYPDPNKAKTAAQAAGWGPPAPPAPAQTQAAPQGQGPALSPQIQAQQERFANK